MKYEKIQLHFLGYVRSSTSSQFYKFGFYEFPKNTSHLSCSSMCCSLTSSYFDEFRFYEFSYPRKIQNIVSNWFCFTLFVSNFYNQKFIFDTFRDMKIYLILQAGITFIAFVATWGNSGWGHSFYLPFTCYSRYNSPIFIVPK